jgi:hypothetical protein
LAAEMGILCFDPAGSGRVFLVHDFFVLCDSGTHLRMSPQNGGSI